MSSGKITEDRIALLKVTVEHRDKVKKKLEEELKKLKEEQEALNKIKDQLKSFESILISSAAYFAQNRRKKGDEKKSIEDRISTQELVVKKWTDLYADRKKELEGLEELVKKYQS